MNEQIVTCLYAAVDEINRQRPGEPQLEHSLDTPLYGSSSALDSLGLVNFIVVVEREIETEFDVAVILADDRALSREPSPFSSIQAFADYIEILLREGV